MVALQDMPTSASVVCGVGIVDSGGRGGWRAIFLRRNTAATYHAISRAKQLSSKAIKRY